MCSWLPHALLDRRAFVPVCSHTDDSTWCSFMFWLRLYTSVFTESWTSCDKWAETAVYPEAIRDKCCKRQISMQFPDAFSTDEFAKCQDMNTFEELYPPVLFLNENRGNHSVSIMLDFNLKDRFMKQWWKKNSSFEYFLWLVSLWISC